MNQCRGGERVVEPFPAHHPLCLTPELIVKILLKFLSSHLPRSYLCRLDRAIHYQDYYNSQQSLKRNVFQGGTNRLCQNED